jgi:putative ABC transport system permease protein
MPDLLLDFRDAWRAFRRDRLYAAAIVGTLALTLGAATAVFSIVNGILLRPLGYPDPQALVSIREIVPHIAHRYPTLAVTPRHFDVWRTRATSFTSMAQMDWRTSTLTGAGDAAQIRVLRTSGTLFDVLQAPVALGRGLTLADERLDGPRVTVISDSLWRERLHGDTGVLGRVLTIGGTDYTIVGVLPRGYALPALQTLGTGGTLSTRVDAIIPFRISLSNFDWMGQFNYGVVARLKNGVTLAQARAEMDVLQATVAEMAKRADREGAELRGWVMPLQETIVGSSARGLVLLLGAVAAVLLIACANLANLTLTRASARMRDAAVRGALGAARWRLVRAALVEQLVLAAIGTAAGIGVAAICLRVFVTTAPLALPRVQDVAIDGRVVAFAGLAGFIAAMTVALLPALKLGRGALESVLRSGGRGSDRGGRRVRAALLTTQVALSVMLLAVSGLFVSSLTRLLRVDAGFAPEGAVTIEIAPVSSRYPSVEARAALYDRILDRVREISGVTSAAWTSALPLTGETWVDAIARPDRPAPGTARPSANYRFVGPDYFRAVGMPILRGRSIDAADRTTSPPPAVISSRAAQSLWPNEDAVGREFTRSDPAVRYRVVGVVADGHVTALDTESPLMVYIPYWTENEGRSVLVVRAQADASAVVASVRRIVRDVDPDVAIAAVAPLQQVVDAAVEGRRYQASLFTAFGGAALLIAILGVYATTAYGVARRTREINIRVALGARASQVFGLVMGQSMAAIGTGVVAGVAGALATSRLIASLLFGVRPRDPVVMGLVIAVVAIAGALAALAAARANLRLDPASALRDE